MLRASLAYLDGGPLPAPAAAPRRRGRGRPAGNASSNGGRKASAPLPMLDTDALLTFLGAQDGPVSAGDIRVGLGLIVPDDQMDSLKSKLSTELKAAAKAGLIVSTGKSRGTKYALAA